MRSATVLAALCLVSVPVGGCSLPRGALGSAALDGSASGVDAAGLDAGTLVRDAGRSDLDAESVDAASGDAASVDAWAPDAPGDCNMDRDCPTDVIELGDCSYATTCATTGTAVQTTTHYTCDHHVCTPHVRTDGSPCTRETDGDPCGPAPTCGDCSATSCGETGTQTCTGVACLAEACVSQTTTQSCTTANNHCGTPDWGFCHRNFNGPCTQERTYGGCLGTTCVPFTGTTESRTCMNC
ncbi:MAG: hypothetical protein U0234_26780 [Sandaracinus sp.]